MIAQSRLHDFYVDHLRRQLLPFWEEAVDTERGGIFTGFDNEGKRLLHRDKFTWSQGRFLWVWSRLGRLMEKGILQGDSAAYKRQAAKTYHFLREYAFLPSGSCRFLLTEKGEPKEMTSGEGHDISFYADCFVIMGFAEYAALTGCKEAYTYAVQALKNVEQRLKDGTARSEPYPVPPGHEVHGYAMILLNTVQSLYRVADVLGESDEARLYRDKAICKAKEILRTFCDSQGRIREVTAAGGLAGETKEPETLLMRHINPGHGMESLWFVLTEAAAAPDEGMIAACAKAMKQTLRMGWDEKYGGLLRYIDLNGGQPRGIKLAGAERFEALIAETWDMKLWWPHSESLYACLLAYRVTKDEEFSHWYEKLHAYTFRVFPTERGREWIQIRTRSGMPVGKVVALPVKDPYHVLRNVLLMIELTV